MTLQLGSSGPVVAAWQRTVLARFKSYALGADGGPLKVDSYFGYDDAAVQREYQRRVGVPQTGVVSDQDLAALSVVKPRPVLFTACGTGVPWWVGPDADAARAVEDVWRWQPVGYRAAPFPMWPSISEGVNELVRLISLPENAGPFALMGYSQGAVVTSLVWKYEILAPTGRLHHRLPDLRKAITFGSPMRERGKLWSDGVGDARPDTAGILEDRLVDTPTWWRDYAHKGDLYSDCELDDEGEYKRAVCKIVMGNNVFGGPDSIIMQVVELLGGSVREAIAVVKAIMDAGMFFGRGTQPHTNYRIQPAIDYLRAA